MCGNGDELVGEVVFRVVQFHMLFAGTDAEHGTGIVDQVVGKVFRPAEWGQYIACVQSANFLDMFHTEGIVFGGSEWLDESVFYFQMVA